MYFSLRNSTINIVVWALAIWAGVHYESFLLALCIPALFHIINDIFFYTLGVTVFSERDMVRTAYALTAHFGDHHHGEGHDLGFNVYDGDTTLSGPEAQQKKFALMWDKLELEPGMRLLDVGCGFGDWLLYAQGRGAIVHGLNISGAQAKVCGERGVEVSVSDWANSAGTEHLAKQFDAITLMDTIEHYVPPTARSCTARQDAVYQALFTFVQGAIDPASKNGRVFISCLHQTRPLDFKRMASTYVIDRSMCGFYPCGEDGLTRNAPQFTVHMQEDRTEDYRVTAVLIKDHFQASGISRLITGERIIKSFVVLLLDPYFFVRLSHYIFPAWMNFYGDDAFSDKYDPEFRAKTTFVKDFFILLRSNTAEGASPMATDAT